MAKPKQKNNIDSELTCGFCNKHFKQETRLFSHMCVKKQRFIESDKKYAKLGFVAFNTFFKMNYRGRKQKTINDFIDSKFYNAFVSFGKYLLKINAVNPIGFIEYLITNAIPINKWELPRIYDEYIRKLTIKETPETAIERNILLMHQWSLETGNNWNDFFRKIEPALAVLWISSGRISPWVLFTASSAQDMLSRLSDEQIKMVNSLIDTRFWELKIKRNKKDVDEIRKILDESGL